MHQQPTRPRTRPRTRRRRWSAVLAPELLAAAASAAVLTGPTAAAPAAAAAGCRATVTVLPGATSNGATAANTRGTVVGAVLVDGVRRPAAWSRTGELTLLPVPVAFGGALDVNARGEIIGLGSGGKVAWHLYRGRVSFLPAAGHGFVYARRINASGEIAGTLDDRAVRWPSYREQPVPLEPAPGDQASFAKGINDAGWVGGDSDQVTDTTFVPRAALWDPAGRLHLLPGISGAGGPGEIFEVNNRRQAAGHSATGLPLGAPGNEVHAARWNSDGTVLDLGTFPGHNASGALGLSANGAVAGYSGRIDYATDDEVPVSHAFVWPGRGPLLALPLPGGRSTADTKSLAHHVDADGTVVGGFVDRDGTYRPVVWRCAFAQGFAPAGTQTIEGSNR